MSKKKQIKGNWIVRVKCFVLKEVYADNCTEEEARRNPFMFTGKNEELNIDIMYWEVKSVEPNE